MPNPEKINIGVIGVGHLGQHHARHLSRLSNINLAGVFDIDQSRCKEIANKYKTTAFTELQNLIDASAGLCVVTPTRAHTDVATQCIKSGKHVFIEKPITQSIKEADALLDLAEKNNVAIQVGHIERLNPALLPLRQFDLNPKFIEVQRLAPYTVRGTDVPVVLDLMIHDIDIILSLVKSPVKNIRATGVSIITDSVDIAHARIRFQNGTVASMLSSRIAKDKVRKVKVFQKDMYVTIDFLLGLTEIYRVLEMKEGDPEALLSAPLGEDDLSKQIVYEKPLVPQIDALQMELENFANVIQGTEKPIVDGRAGRDALDIATQIHDLIVEDLH